MGAHGLAVNREAGPPDARLRRSTAARALTWPTPRRRASWHAKGHVGRDVERLVVLRGARGDPSASRGAAVVEEHDRREHHAAWPAHRCRRSMCSYPLNRSLKINAGSHVPA